MEITRELRNPIGLSYCKIAEEHGTNLAKEQRVVQSMGMKRKPIKGNQ